MNQIDVARLEYNILEVNYNLRKFINKFNILLKQIDYNISS